MKHIEIWYNPYRLETKLLIDEEPPRQDSTLQYAVTKGKRLQEWVTRFPKDLCNECGSKEFRLSFHGMALDWDDMREAIAIAQRKGEIGNVETEFYEAPSDEEIREKIIRIFQELQSEDAPVDAFRDQKLIQAFQKLSENIFPINVIATMSSGKSTLINALLGKKLMPSKNEACTAMITEILDTNTEYFSAKAYNMQNELLETIHQLTYQEMERLNDKADEKINDDIRVSRIAVRGDIPFLDSKGTSLLLVDTPGPNSSRNESHKQTTYQAIANGSNNLILYIMDGTHLHTNDEHSLLAYVAEQIKKGGKQARDRFLFVINKMDMFNPEEESVEQTVISAKDYLASFGIEDPQIYPCSAYTALNIRTLLNDVDINQLTRAQERKLPQAARDTIAKIYAFNDNSTMHLEKYSTLTPTAQHILEERLERALEEENEQEQALIHSGILSLEAAIVAYVKKYAITKMVKDLVEHLEAVLESQHVFAKAKQAITENEEIAEACRRRAKAVEEQINNGEESKVFRNKVQALDPIQEIREHVNQKQSDIYAEMTAFFQGYDLDYVFDNQKEARKIVETFAARAEEIVYPLSADLAVLIDENIRNKGLELLDEYRQYLQKVDENAGCSELEFSTSELISDKLRQMQDAMTSMGSTGYAMGKVEEVGETYEEDETYITKIGTEEIQVKVGSHQEQVDTKLVKTGSHKEKVGTQRVKNPNRRFLQFWKPKYIDVDVYQTVDDYTEEAVYATVDDYETQTRDVYGEKTRKVEKFRLEFLKLQGELLKEFMDTVKSGLQKTMSSAEEQAEELRTYFASEFDRMDKLIEQKYQELLMQTEELEVREKELEKARKIREWLEGNIQEIHDILDLKEE